MKPLKAEKIRRNIQKFTTPVVLEETTSTRRCFYGDVSCDNEGEWHLRGTIMCERKGKDGWQPQDGATLNELKGGEIAKLTLRTEHIRKLIDGLQVLNDAAKSEGVELSSADLVVGRRDELLRVGKQHKAVIEQLIENDYSQEFWEALTSLRPELTAQLAEAEILRRRKEAVAEFERELENRLVGRG